MASLADRQQQYEQNDVPAAWRTYVANGIRKKFADQFDFGDLSDQDVIQRHHDRFGADMSPEDYAAKLDKTYGTGFKPPAPPKATLSDRAAQVGEAGKSLAEGIAPFVVPEVGKGVALKAGAKAVATKIPFVSQVGFLGGHAINEAVDTATAAALQKAGAALPVPDTDAKAQEYYDKLAPSLSAKGYSPDQIMHEARARAENVTKGYLKTTESIDKDVQDVQSAAATEPARAASDAFFLGVGAPAIEGMLNKGLAKLGYKMGAVAAKPASAIGSIASHIKTGAVIGTPGMAIQGAITAGVQSAADNKSPQEIAQALVKGGVSGAKIGALGGAALGALAGTAEAGLGAAVKPLVERARRLQWEETQAQAAVDRARLRNWQEYDASQRSQDIVREDQSRAAIARTADNFDPHTTTESISGDPAEAATTIIQKNHGPEAAFSEAGLRAASKIEERLRLYNDANADLEAFSKRELPPPAPEAPQPEITGAKLPPTPENPPTLGPPLGPVEQGGRALPPPAEIAPRELGTPAPKEGAVATTATPPVEKNIPKVEFQPAAPADFRKSVKKAVETMPGAAGSLTLHPPSYYTKPGVEMYMTPDGKTGYALVPRPDGGKELVSGFNMGEKGMGLAGVREAVMRGATHLDAIKPLEHVYEKAGFRTVRTEKNWVPGQPDVVFMEQPGAPQAPAPHPAEAALGEIKVGKHAELVPGEGGAIHIARLGLPGGEAAKPGAIGSALDAIVRKADERQLPTTIQITQTPGPRGGMIPVEKLLPWYESRGFKMVDSTKLPEGQIGTATLRREPVPPPAKKMDMLEAQRVMMERAIAKPETPVVKELAAPAVQPAPGRWHQMDLWADTNIAAARERIKAREAEFPEADRKKAREAGFIGEKAGHRDPTSYDWADFADRVHIGVNMMLKYGLNKTEWVERMVKELGGKFRDIADRVYQESVAVYNARRPKGLDDVRRVVADYTHQSGLGLGSVRHDVFPEVDTKFAERVAAAYDGLKDAKPGSAAHREAAIAYDALNHEVELQYKAMLDAGYKVTFTKEDPYPTSADMRADVEKNKHLKVFASEETHHPFMTAEQTNKFRAVHDFFGHAAEGYEFGPRGEDAAFRKHASTLSNRALPALATETRGQNSWVNYWPANAALVPSERPFAQQKFGLLPSWTYEDVLKDRLNRAPANRLAGDMIQRSTRGDDRALSVAAQKLARGVRPVKTPEKVRARFVADGANAINEMMSISPESANWYHDDIAKMHALTQEEIPALAQPGHQALFDLLLAFTSPNTNVPQNYSRALTLMRDFERTGKVPMLQRFGKEVNITSRNWVPRLNGLIQKHGGDLDALRNYLLTQDPKTGTYNVEKEFGPKVGPFTLNIQGIHNQVTVDVWMVRRLRRLAGVLHKEEDGKQVLNENWSPTTGEARDIKAGVIELSKRTGLDPDAVQAVLWDNEKMIWERAGLASPRIPFSVAAEGVLTNMRKGAESIAKEQSKSEQQTLKMEKP